MQSNFNLCAYTDSDFDRLKNDIKSTSGTYFFDSCLVSWMCKKENYIALSPAEYILGGLDCGQIL